MIKTANLIGSVSRKAGGLHESVRRLVQSLAETGMGVAVFGLEDEFTREDLATWVPVKVEVFPTVWPHSFGYARGYLRQLNRFAPEITHTHGLWMYPGVANNRYCRRTGSRYMISPHGMLDLWAIRRSGWKKALAYFFYEETHLRGAACLRALCQSEARSIRRLGLKNPVCLIPNGIDPVDSLELESSGPRDCKNTGPQQSVIKQLKNEGHKVLLYLGRIHPKKGLANLLRSWALAQKEQRPGTRGEWILAVAGWDQGGHAAELQRLATELAIPWREAATRSPATGDKAYSTVGQLPSISGANSLVFLGPQFGADKAACYRDCDAFILPSLSEGLPMVVLEAWSHGKPVLMTAECNLPEGFDAGAAMRIGANVPGIVAGLREMCGASDATRSRMGEAGRRLVAERFAWPKVAADLKSVYEWILGGGSPPACVLPGD